MPIKALLLLLLCLPTTTLWANCNCSQEPLGNQLNFFSNVQGVLTNSLVRCHELNIGESAVVNWLSSISPTNVGHAYRLTRMNAREFRTEVRLNFIPSRGENISAAQISHLNSRISRCLQDSAPFLQGPEGRSLRIELSNDPAVPASTITLTQNRIRETANHYSLSINCPTIIHEILHLHGLCDEYREETIGIEIDSRTGQFTYVNSPGAPIAFDCRHLGPERSVMRNAWAAVTDSRDWEKWEFEVCAGAEQSQPSQNSCGNGAQKETHYTFIAPGTPFIEPQLGTNFRILPGTEQRAGTRPRTLTSLLEPAHFRAITAPGCDINARYYACSRNSQRSSALRATIGGGISGIPLIPSPNNAANGCPETPPECRNPERWTK